MGMVEVWQQLTFDSNIATVNEGKYKNEKNGQKESVWRLKEL